MYFDLKNTVTNQREASMIAMIGDPTERMDVIHQE